MDTTDLNYQVDSFAKDLSTIFMNVVNSGKVSDFRDIFQTMDEDNSGKHRVYGSTVVIVIVIFYELIPLLMCCMESYLSNKSKQCILHNSNIEM